MRGSGGEVAVATAVAFRERLGLGRGETDAFRVADGDADGLPGIAIDAFAGRWLVQPAVPRAPAVELVRACLRHAAAVWWKLPDPAAAAAPHWLAGELGPARFLVRENGMRFWIDFAAGYSQGLFLDQRLNRAEVRARSGPGDRILNLFSYTGGFSVAAAAGGATTTSLDLSQHYLDWGKENLSANCLDPAAHHYCRGDALEWLGRWAKSGRRFDGVVADPPTFSRCAGGRVWQAASGFPELAGRVARVVEPGGWALFSSNRRGTGAGAFSAAIRAGVRQAGREAKLKAATMPPDFRADPYLNAVWVQFS
jgi:23S rRNA (cytosine1962-C5)-methyltransferase